MKQTLVALDAPPRTIHVPDIVHPTLCWKQEVKNGNLTTFERCTKPKGHDGKHTWQE